MELNPAQQEAVDTLSGPLLVLAGAGTGKTRVVTCRIARLIQSGVPPERILGVTFTNKAADEMQERVRLLLGQKRGGRPEISTFHSLCLRILRRNIHHLGYPAQFAICDRQDQQSLARSVLREIRVHDAALRPAELLAYVSRWKSRWVDPKRAAETAQTDKEHLAAAAYRRYQAALKAQGAVDFDDLLLLTAELLGRFPSVVQSESGRFDYLLVDEYQDTNAIQYRIVRDLARRHRNLCVVGDDDQAIYGWRGAEVEHILRFKHDWPDAKVVRLETNYRSTRQILEWANRLIAFNRLRHPKVLRATRRGARPRILQLKDEEHEAQAVVADIRQRIAARAGRPGDFAVLFRTNDQTRPFEAELRRAGLPYVLLGGQSFYDRKEVRDLLAYLRLIVNPRDDASLLRVINTPPRGIGQAAVGQLIERAVTAGVTLGQWVLSPGPLDVAPAAAEGLKQFGRLLRQLRRQAERASVPEVVRQVVEKVRYEDELARLYPDENERAGRRAAVEEVINAAASYAERSEQPTLAGFLQELALITADDPRDRETRLPRDAVALLTLHAAKGLEFPEVYMVGMEEGLLPHKKSIEAGGNSLDEERRLCYVGMTRAQRRLTLTMALGRRKWGKLRPTVPSRFLYEATGQADNPHYAAAVRGQHRRTNRPNQRRAKSTR